MITLPSFRLHRPRTLDEALHVLAAERDAAKVIAGGTDLVPNLRNRLFEPRHVVSLARVRGLGGIDLGADGSLRVGALATVWDLSVDSGVRAQFPALASAAASVSGPTLRRMGTVGGGLCLDTRCQWYNQSRPWRSACGFCLKKDGDICHVAPGSSLCWAAYSGDLAPAFLVLDALVVIASERRERVMPLRRFYLEDGARKFDLAPDEIVTEVRVPAGRAGCQGSYAKLRARAAVDFPLAGVAVFARVADGVFEDAAVALTAVGPRPFLVEGVRELLEGRSVRDEEAVARTARLARRVANPMKTGGPYSPAHRRHRVGLCVLRALSPRRAELAS